MLNLYLALMLCLGIGISAQANYDCNFEQGLCGWTQDTSDQNDWIWYSGYSHPVYGNVPNHYIYVDYSVLSPGQKARLISTTVEPSPTKCLRFWYHMLNQNTLNIYLKVGSDLGEPVWSLTGVAYDHAWHEVNSIELPKESSYNIVFEAVKGPGYQGDITLDEIMVTTCPVTDPCAQNPCANGGTCTNCDVEYCDDPDASYTCSCAPGFHGPNCDLVNLAPNKDTYQTGLKKGKKKFHSSMAVDGDVTSCAKTNRRRNPKWWIDLDGSAFVKMVTLRGLGPGHRALGVNVTVFIGEDACHMSQVCDTYVGPSVDSHTFLCPEDTIGRYVFAQRFTEYEDGRARREPFRVLRICEAEVFGYFAGNQN